MIILMIRITLPYFQLDQQTGFLRIKQWIVDNDLWMMAFYVHVFTSAFLLFSGFTQFSNRLLVNKPEVHREMGKLYIGILLLFSAPSGLIMGIFANGGIVSQVAFVLLSILWIYFTLQAYVSIRKRDFEAHGRHMIRSYALTLSALTLRLWKPTLAKFDIPPMDLYRIVSWLGWIPNIIVAEYIIRRGAALRMIQRK